MWVSNVAKVLLKHILVYSRYTSGDNSEPVSWFPVIELQFVRNGKIWLIHGDAILNFNNKITLLSYMENEENVG